MLLFRLQRLTVYALALVGANACGRLPGSPPATASVWLLPAPEEGLGLRRAGISPGIAVFEGELIVIDSSTLRPVKRKTDARGTPDCCATGKLPDGTTSRVALVTTYQGARYHPESIRALTEDPQVVAAFAGSLGRLASENNGGLFIDFQGDTPDELSKTTSILRVIADSTRGHGLRPIGIVVPPGDTIGYPTGVLARIADLIVVRLHGEHRQGTSPGPLVSPEWMTRQIGMRAYEIGIDRLVAELPLFGYLWDRVGGVRSISYSEAQALVRHEAGVFRRDPVSGSLTATSARDGWTIWIGDAETLRKLVTIARREGVHRFALLGVAGADPAIWTDLPAAFRRR